MAQHNERNLTMMMDLYEITMANGYFRDDYTDELVTFDVFFRKVPDGGGFAIFAGLEQILDYLENMHFDADDIEYLRGLDKYDEKFLKYLSTYKFKGDVMAMHEGTIMYPNEPIITITAPLIDAQLVETFILSQVNHQSLIATKTRRIVAAAEGRAVSDFGARRAHNVDAAVYGARAAYIAGAVGTATVLAGQMFDIPVSGTMAHSWVMYHDTEYDAFAEFCKMYPDDAVLLVDTYDVIESGVPNAIKAAKDVLWPQGKRLKGIRLDSGDLAYLSKESRALLDEADMEDCIIIVSNSLDEFTIRSLLEQGAKIDSFGVGERLITAKSDPVFGAVYKISSAFKNGRWIPKIKISETVEKITNPGRKSVYRVYDKDGHALADLLTLEEETPDFSKPYIAKNELKPWKNYTFEGCSAKPLLHKYMENGKRLIPTQKLADIKEYVKNQLDTEIWEEEQRVFNPHDHYLDMSVDYYNMKLRLLDETNSSN